MNKIRLITDSASDMPLTLLKEYEIDLVPLNLIVGDKTYKDDQTIPMSVFWDIMEKEVLKTSQPSPDSFLELFEKAKENNEEVVVVTISSELSGTYQCAQLAKSIVDYEPIYIIDSKGGSVSEEILILKADELRKEGLSGKEIAGYLDEFKNRIRLYVAFDTLTYLSRGGRIPKSLSTFGDTLKIKPVLALEEGNLVVRKVNRGLKKAIKNLNEIVEEVSVDTHEKIIPIYSKDKSICLDFIETLKENGFDYPYQEPREMGCIISCHAGPNAFGIVYVEKMK